MNKKTVLLLSSVCLFLACSDQVEFDVSYLSPAEKQVDNQVDGIIYGSGNWEEISYEKAFESLGNHRAVITASAGHDAVWLHLPWRRRDINDVQKRVIIINAETRDTVRNMIVREYNNAFADILFKPGNTGNVYHVYYYPFITTGSYYPKVSYMPAVASAEEKWSRKYENLATSDFNDLPKAEITSIESINDFNSFFPMEVATTGAEMASFKLKYPGNYYLFPEYRDNPIRMTQHLPYHWVTRPYYNGLSDQVLKGEYYAFQIAIYAATSDLENVSLSYTDLTAGSRDRIGKEQIECINVDGVDLNGQPFKKKINVPRGKIQALWFGINIPE